MNTLKVFVEGESFPRTYRYKEWEWDEYSNIVITLENDKEIYIHHDRWTSIEEV